MPDSKQLKKPKKKASRKKDSTQAQPERLSAEKKKKLDELDDFIDGVLEEAGEDFLDQFRQIEGE